MNIRTSFTFEFGSAGLQKVFSEDVLKIEICGPGADYLTVIDVPGIFRSADEFTTKEDQNLVLKMVRRYIKNDRTIILAVLPANVDVQTQEILDLAEQYDKEGERTLGILTKVDLCEERSSKIPVCNLVLGKKKPLRLGYYLVRNLGGDEDETVDVAQKEAELFAEAPWNDLPQDRLGIEPLRARLTELLSEITDKSFPRMRTQSREMMADAQRELEGLGVSRQTEREQQLYLTTLASQFQGLIRAALDAEYSRHVLFGERDSLRLITFVVNLSERFSNEFDERAHARQFEHDAEKVEKPAAVEVARPVEEYFASPSPQIVFPDEEDYPASSAPASSAPDNEETDPASDFSGAKPDDYPDLRGIVTTDWAVGSPDSGILEWIKELYYQYRGVELGTFGPGILPSAFREQSKHWKTMAHQYVSKVVLFIHRFITEALEIVCPDARVRDQILSSITDDLLARYRSGVDHAMFLVSAERDQRPYTLNHYFNDNLQVCRGIRVSNALKSKARYEQVNRSGDRGKLVVEFDAIKGAITDQSNAEHAQQDIHDILKSYYKVARKRFVDNVYLQAVDHFLLSGPESPLAVFCERWVVMLDREKLEDIAGESRL